MLFDREAELAVLDRLTVEVRDGAGAVALIEGPPGSGRTSLLGQALGNARREGWQVAYAGGGAVERALPYGVVRQLFEPLTDAHPVARAALLGGPARAALAGSPPPASGRVLFGVASDLHRLTAQLTGTAPLLLAVDDADLADPASLHCLGYLARRLVALPVLLIVTRPDVVTRPDDDGAAPGAVALEEISRQPHCHLLRPRPLSPSAVRRVAERVFAGPVDQGFASACHAASRGRPGLVRDLLTTLAERGVPPVASASTRIADVGAGVLAAAALARLRRQPVQTLGVARLLAVLDGATAELLGALCGLEAEAVAHPIGVLRGLDVLADGPGLRFTHPMVPAALAAEVGEADRSRLHARAARLLADQQGCPELAANHLLLVEPSGDPWVCAMLREGARSARSHGELDVAAGYLRRALREPPSAARRATVLVDLAGVEVHRDPAAAAAHLADAWDASVDPVQRARVAAPLAHALLLSTGVVEGARVLDEAVRGLAVVGGDAAAVELGHRLGAQRVLSCYADLVTVGRVPGHVAELDPDLPGDTPGERAVLAVLGIRATAEGRSAATAADLADRAFAAADELAPDDAVTLFLCATMPYIHAGRTADAALWYRTVIAGARRRGAGTDLALALCARSRLRLSQGRIAEALADGRAALAARSEEQWGSMLPFPVSCVMEALLEQDRLDEAAALAGTEFTRRAQTTVWEWGWFLRGRARVRLARGDHSGALADMLAAGERYALAGIVNPAAAPWRSGSALLHAALGDPVAAGRLAAEELTLAGRWGAPRPLGVALRAAGQLARGQRRMDLLHRSVEALRGAEAPLDLARSLIAFGAARHRAGDTGAARAVLREAVGIADDCGATVLLRRAHCQLTATGARPRRLHRHGVAALTRSELRVAELAALGHTNREIAATLFVTARTVETHLTSTYRKLGLSKRAELAGQLT
jgi:DNA-binding CsgD family transcriptional regulator